MPCRVLIKRRICIPNPALDGSGTHIQVVMRYLRGGILAALLALTGCATSAGTAAEAGPQGVLTAQRQIQLVRLVRQDCGACHGIRLTGGLGPAITPSALPGRTPEGVSVTILYGHPGTPMPGWQGMLSEADARWIAERLLAGFPEEP